MNTLILLPVPHQTCAHLYELRQRVSQPSETRDPIGRCYVLSEDLTERDDLDGGEWKFCEGRPQGHEQFGFCQQGLSVSFTPDNNFILFGAPGTYNWKGKVSDWAAEGWIRKTTLHVERFTNVVLLWCAAWLQCSKCLFLLNLRMAFIIEYCDKSQWIWRNVATTNMSWR